MRDKHPSILIAAILDIIILETSIGVTAKIHQNWTERGI